VRNGADVTLRTGSGLSMMHLAARGNSVKCLTYFKAQGLNINQVDERQSTPLHHACANGSENAVSFLLGWGANVHAQDQDGNTPLHLATIHNLSFTKLLSIKELLIHGASRDKLNADKLRPIDCELVTG